MPSLITTMSRIRIDKRSELVAVCDPNEQLLQQRSRTGGSRRSRTKYQDIANDPDVDAVIIATPNFTHHEIVLACAKGGKHMMCEKPLGLNFAESAEMYRARARDNTSST